MYYFKKMINNNVAIAYKEDLSEYVIIGKGIGFKKRLGDEIDKSIIEKKYTLIDARKNNLLSYLSEVDYKIFLVSDKIKKLVESKCNMTYTNYMYLSLVDHISGTLTRLKMDIHIDSEISKEDLEFYKREYDLALKSVNIIDENLNVKLSENEINFLTLHFIGFLYDLKYTKLNDKVVSVTNDILKLINDEVEADVEKYDDYSMQRFITHLKFFIMRQYNKVDNDISDEEFNETIYNMLSLENKEAEKLLIKIILYLEEQQEFTISKNEWLYLLIHLIKIMK